MSSSSISRFLASLVLAAGLSSCGTDRDAPATAANALRTPASEQAQAATGLSHLPRPQNPEALRQSLARHYPKERAGVRPSTSVLVDVSLDANGRVQNVAVVDPPPAATASVALIEPGSKGEVQRAMPATVYDPAFGPAAAAALKEVRFHPARKDGQPVPFTMRMSVEFTSPAS
jgi:hypothetical protein